MVVPRGLKDRRKIGRKLKLTRDHVTPKAMGGRFWWNKLLTHAACNNRKGDRPPHPCELLYLEASNLRIVGRRERRAAYAASQAAKAKEKRGRPVRAHQ